MHLKIDSRKLTDSPFSESNKSAFIFDDDELLNSVVIEITHARPSSFLISGYRGVGKTSFINRIFQKVGNDSISANINLAKYEGYPRLIKKLIRHLFISFEASNLNSKVSDTDLQKEFKLLYDRTFNDIVSSNIYGSKEEFKLSSEAKINIKQLLFSLSFLFLSLLSINSNFFLVKGLNWIAIILSGIWLAASWRSFASFSKSSIDSKELSRKSLYDDEIAEHHLFNLLKKLNSKNISVLISFDEIDKLQDVNSAIKILDDIKPLLLSGFANFFIVAGQDLYYEYERSKLKDNEVISTLFSRSIHIPFLNNTTLKGYFLNLLEDRDLKTDMVVNDFIDALLLTSSRIPRKLVNQIRSKLVWNEPMPFLDIEESKKRHYAYDAKLLSCLTDIMDNQLPLITDSKVQLDFYIAQIFLWLAKMRTHDSIPFIMSKILDSRNYNYVPESYVAQLQPLGEMLTDNLTENKFLIKKRSDDDMQEDAYIWQPSINAILDENQLQRDIRSTDDPTKSHDENQNFDNKFITDFAQLESLARKILSEIDQEVEQLPNRSFKMMINILVERNVLTKSWYESSRIDDILTIRNQIVHGNISEENGVKKIQGVEFNLSRLKAEIIENYVLYVCKRSFKDFQFNKHNRGGFDFVGFKPALVLTFDVKHVQPSDGSVADYKQLFYKFKTFREITNQDCYYLLICFHSALAVNNAIYYSKINKILDENYPDLKQFVKVINLMEEAGSGIGSSLSETLMKVKVNLPNPVRENNTFHTFEERNIIEENIEKGGLHAWPDDFMMQLNFQDNQRDALREISKLNHVDLGEEQFDIIAKKAKLDWPTDYQMQLQTFKDQSEALYQIRKLKADPLSEPEFKQILSRSTQKWLSDYKMILQDFERQKQALILLKNFKADGINEQKIVQLKAKAKTEWPEDYEMQLNTLQTDISSIRKWNES